MSLIMFGVILIVVALLSAALNPAYNTMSNATAAIADSSQANQGLNYLDTFWKWKSFLALLLAVVMLLAGAAAESRRGI